MHDPAPIAFVADDGDVRVNFGIFAGREATAAEIEALAHELLGHAHSVTVVAEHRFLVDRDTEASVHQIRVEAGGSNAAALLPIAERWAWACIAERHTEL